MSNITTSELNIGNRRGEQNWIENALTICVWGLAFAATTGILLWMSAIVFKDALPAIKAFGLSFLWSQTWNIGREEFGALPFIYGTLVTSLCALVLALAFGIAVAIVTSENFLPVWVRYPLAFLVELIASIPSVIVGLWGIFVLVPTIQPIQQGLYAHFKWLPPFSTEPLGFGLLAAIIILAVMILPTIAAISRDVLLALPQEMRSASMSLGATRWETIWRILLPAGCSGIVGAAILALGRALGETMAVTMVIGNSIQISPSLLAPGYTIPSVLATQFPEALEPLHVGSLMYLASILFAITLGMNLIAVSLVQAIARRASR
ncbi:phosphate ABC transporter permease subunit PstC [Oscillatoria sp. FACHB-1406]|uniref:phosphate ABC transporter permease subunit PstC n=1 Tax=Oscillatoria sp. FACHB-1406 TaxID=2692846 RepID=UPI00168327F7|nr:phosphate ABC transporter permease subunit PstC [Oscillatoria sp. FACHB-1406]MBD2578014.1 phosphate ABC transporter permease subunit PstC [Oscillatoria sp. FACHB-1406]